jgi:hypothetical protein
MHSADDGIGRKGALMVLSRNPWSAVALAACCALLQPACKGGGRDYTAASVEGAADSLTEEGDDGSITWTVAPDGLVRAVLKSLDGKVLSKAVTGQLTVKAPAAAPVVVPIETKGDVLVAKAPKLEDGITEMSYALVVDGKPRTGTLDLPQGGTQELVATAKLAADRGNAEGKPGPNGGVVQVVGDDQVEIVADKTTGQVRIFVIDADGKTLPVGDRKVQIAIAGAEHETILLTPEPNKLFFVGVLKTRAEPKKLTIAITVHGATRVCLVGFTPHSHILVGSRAPRVNVWVRTGWDHATHEHDDDDDDRSKGKVHVNVHGDHGHGHGHGKGGGQVHVNVHVH